jgi:hypothetical protein
MQIIYDIVRFSLPTELMSPSLIYFPPELFFHARYIYPPPDTSLSADVDVAVEKKFPGDRERFTRMSLIEGTSHSGTRASDAHVFLPEGFPKQVRMAHLACVGK